LSFPYVPLSVAIRRASAALPPRFSARIGGFAASLFGYCSCSAVTEERAQRCGLKSEARSADARRKARREAPMRAE
jgi:hypothetical protein